MRICWDNLENSQYNPDKNCWIIKGNNYYYHEFCKKCGDPFLRRKTVDSKYCCRSCSSLDISDETKYKISKKLQNHIVTDETRRKLQNINGAKHRLWLGDGDCVGFDTYAPQISFAEEIRRSLDNKKILEVKCKYCGKWHKPTSTQIKNRLKNLNSIDGRYFYCSDECKYSCPIFWKHKHPKGFTGDVNSSREVQPELRKLVLERDNFTCQSCGLSSDNSCVELHCHHIDPVALNPIESADVDNCITLCKDCHHEAHQKDGCGYGQLKNCVNI